MRVEQNVYMGLYVWVTDVVFGSRISCMCEQTQCMCPCAHMGQRLPYQSVYACPNQCHSGSVCVHSCQRRKSFAWSPTGGLDGQERMFIKGLWVVLFVSYTVRKKTSHSTFCPLREIIHHSHHAIARDDVSLVPNMSLMFLHGIQVHAYLK